VSQKSPSSFCTTGYIVPGPGPEAAQLAPDGEPLPVPVGLQDQLLQLAGRPGALEGLGQLGIDPRHQLAQVGDLVQIDGRHITLDAIADALELQAAVQPGLAVELEVTSWLANCHSLPSRRSWILPLQPEPVQLTLFLILPDQIVVAKRQQRI
jgi:hypothetical protein